jgi:hypothetical protein
MQPLGPAGDASLLALHTRVDTSGSERTQRSTTQKACSPARVLFVRGVAVLVCARAGALTEEFSQCSTLPARRERAGRRSALTPPAACICAQIPARQEDGGRRAGRRPGKRVLAYRSVRQQPTVKQARVLKQPAQ